MLFKYYFMICFRKISIELFIENCLFYGNACTNEHNVHIENSDVLEIKMFSKIKRHFFKLNFQIELTVFTLYISTNKL